MMNKAFKEKYHKSNLFSLKNLGFYVSESGDITDRYGSTFVCTGTVISPSQIINDEDGGCIAISDLSGNKFICIDVE